MDASQMDASQCQWKFVVGTKPSKMIYQVPPPSKKNCLWVGGGKAPCLQRKASSLVVDETCLGITFRCNSHGAPTNAVNDIIHICIQLS